MTFGQNVGFQGEDAEWPKHGNCAKCIVELGRKKELIIDLHHVMGFSSVLGCEAVMLNTGLVVYGYGVYLEEAVKITEG